MHCFQDVAKGLQELLDYDGNVEDDFCLTFQVHIYESHHEKTCLQGF